MTRKVGFMPLGSFERMLEQIPSRQRILRLHHFGEALLHPDLVSFIRLSRSAGFIPLISLVPSGLTGDLIDKLVDSGIGIVCFSLDSLRSERLKKIRGITKTAEYCLEMIDDFILKSRSAPEPILKIIQMVSLTLNRDERLSFLSLKERYPDNDVYVYVADNCGFGNRELVRDTNENAEGDRGTGTCCSAPFDDVVILWNGDVVLCCYDHDGFNVIGNINEDSLKNIWQSEKVKRIRDLFMGQKTGDLPLCGTCVLAPHHIIASTTVRAQRGLADEKLVLDLYQPLNQRLHERA
jgi:radical SAM protein with 4Fe4S-binding SPASM domain